MHVFRKLCSECISILKNVSMSMYVTQGHAANRVKEVINEYVSRGSKRNL